MKYFVVPIMIALVLTQSFSKWMIYMEYRLNSEYISHNLCVNRSRPVMHCHGKCQMMKKMAEEEKQDTNAPAPGKIKTPQALLFCNSLEQPGLEAWKSDLPRPYSPYLLQESNMPPPPIFHPPLAS